MQSTITAEGSIQLNYKMGCGNSKPIPSTFDKEQMKAVEEAKNATLPPKEDGVAGVAIKAGGFVK